MKFTMIKYILLKQDLEKKKQEIKKQNPSKPVIVEYSPTKGKIILKI